MPDPAQQVVKYPEHQKLRAVVDKSQCVHDFLEWLQEQGIVLAKRHEHTEGCYGTHNCKEDPSECSLYGECRRRGKKVLRCGCHTDELYDHTERPDKIIARYFEIDLKRLDDEKREMLEECRQQGKEST